METVGSDIEVDELTMVYPSASAPVHALDQISFSIEPGEFVSVLGPSGCGKSTLLMLIAGLRRRTAGDVRVGGNSVDGPQTELGVVFQRDVLLDWRSNIQNVLLQIELRKLRPADYRERAQELLTSVGLGGFEDKRPYELSGGMRQRVAICRALVHDPPILLMDEPFGALDALTREQMMVDLESLWMQSRKTVVFITHSIPEAVFLSDRIVIMSPRPGRVHRIVEVGLPRPRSLDDLTSAEFNLRIQDVRDTFQEMGVFSDVH
jgi:NitT/TauT family transport system ATP-binding protein